MSDTAILIIVATIWFVTVVIPWTILAIWIRKPHGDAWDDFQARRRQRNYHQEY